MAHESTVAVRYLIPLLEGAAPLPGGWHRGIAPQGSAFPFGIVDSGGAGIDENAAGGRVLSSVPMMIKVVCIQAEQDEAAAAALEAIDAALSGARTTQNGQRIRVIAAGTLPEYTETGPGSVNYRHQGRTWRLVIGPLEG